MVRFDRRVFLKTAILAIFSSTFGPAYAKEPDMTVTEVVLRHLPDKEQSKRRFKKDLSGVEVFANLANNITQYSQVSWLLKHEKKIGNFLLPKNTSITYEDIDGQNETSRYDGSVDFVYFLKPDGEYRRIRVHQNAARDEYFWNVLYENANRVISDYRGVVLQGKKTDQVFTLEDTIYGYRLKTEYVLGPKVEIRSDRILGKLADEVKRYKALNELRLSDSITGPR